MKHRINLALSLINHQEPTEQVLAEVEAALRGATIEQILSIRKEAKTSG